MCEMCKEIFDSEFMKAVEEIECPGSKWMYLYTTSDAAETGIGEELQEKYGYSAQAVRDQIEKIRAQSSDDLIKVALSGGENAEAACAALQIRTTEPDKERALRLIDSDVAEERALGVRMVTHYRDSEFQPAILSRLYELSKTEKDSEVLEDLCFAMSHLGADEAVRHLEHLVDHESPAVRFALANCFFATTEPGGLFCLRILARDEVDEVRNWAVTGLGASVDVIFQDLEYSRKIFLERLDDENGSTRLEAMSALIKLGEKGEKVLSVLKTELNTDPVPLIAIEAATLFASPLLKEALVSLRERTELNDLYLPYIELAVEACQV